MATEEKVINPYYGDWAKKEPVGFWFKLFLRLLPTYTVCESPLAIHYKTWRKVVYIVGQEKLSD